MMMLNKTMETDLSKSTDELLKENRRLKRTNRLLGAYVIASFIIMLYNYYGHLLH
jgi:hypothetical protein